MTIEIRPCAVAALFDHPRGPALIAEYAEECGNALIGKPAPRRDLYENLEVAGLGQCFMAYEDDALCGFAMVIASVVPHYGLSCATTESIFVTLGSRAGTALMRTLNDYAAELGCIVIFYVAPVGSRFAQMLSLCADEYPNTNHVYAKRLK